MIKSMTGFGRFEVTQGDRKIIVEIKGVNHRYCDINIKMPKKLGFFEGSVRNLLKKQVSRGKIDVYISFEDSTEQSMSLKYNHNMAKAYVETIWSMSKEFGISNDLTATKLSHYPEVLSLEEQTFDEQQWLQLIEDAVKGACQQFTKTRETEGLQLQQDLLAKLDGMLETVDYIEKASPEVVKAYQEKLTLKVEELLENSDVDQNRILTEVTLFADKICVDEETVRLRSHISGAKAALQEDGEVGRKLDFIAQEMNREANTILSKASDLSITNKAIDLKTEIEKVREQIQNIE